MSEELKACPMCGGTAQFSENASSASVFCTSCPVQIIGHGIGDPAMGARVIEQWNTRAEISEKGDTDNG